MATTVSGGPPARPLRVLIVTDQYEPMVGGVPTVTRELAAGLGERGHAVAVLALLTGFDPDVAHLHSPLTLGAAARSAARRRLVPVVYTNHYLPQNVWPAGPLPFAPPCARPPSTPA
jgi:glycosyltransferase involved in cell wall biosynthesis